MRRRLALRALYPIVDEAFAPPERFTEVTHALVRAGACVVQVRAKRTSDRRLSRALCALAAAAPPAPFTLIVDDRADLCAAAARRAHAGVTCGVHVGQDDLAPAAVRRVVGAKAIVGLSTHDEDQVLAAQVEPVDYIGFGPVFATRTKADPDPEVGCEGVRRASAASRVPVVAIGGIDASSAPRVWAAGAAAVAIISALYAGLDLTVEAGMLALEARARALVQAGERG